VLRITTLSVIASPSASRSVTTVCGASTTRTRAGSAARVRQSCRGRPSRGGAAKCRRPR
jgi:hypothetical protein